MAQPAPSTSYSGIELPPGKPVRLGYYAGAHKNCTPAPLPTFQMIEPPKLGAATVRRGILTTNRVAGCPGLKTPVVAVFYEPRDNARGTDHVVYQIANANGAINIYDVTIQINEASAAPQPSKGEKI